MEEKEKRTVVDEKVDSTSWISQRDAAVNAAVATHDEDALRKMSTMPGGYGSKSARRRAW